MRERLRVTAAVLGVGAALLGATLSAGCERPAEDTYARVDGEVVTRAELEALAELLATRQLGKAEATPDDAFEAWLDAHVLRAELAEQGLDGDATYRERLAAVRARAFRAEQELARTALVRRLEESIEIGEEDLRALYEENAQRYLTTRLHLRQITVPDRATILGIRKQLADGAAFDELARRANLDPALRQKGGDLGWVEQRKLPTSVLGPAHRLLEPGQVTDPFEDREGRWHLVQLVARERSARRSFESVRDQLESELRIVRSREQLAERLAARREALRVERAD